MKTMTCILLFCLGLLSLQAEEDHLIPTPLDAVIQKIHSGLTIPEVEKILITAYPKAKGEIGNWSGQTGYINYKLDERYTLTVSSVTRGSEQVVQDEIFFLLYDWPSKRCIELKIHYWEKKKPT